MKFFGNDKSNDRLIIAILLGCINVTLPIPGFVHFVNNLVDDSDEGNLPYIISGIIGTLLSIVLFFVFFKPGEMIYCRFLLIAYGHFLNFVMFLANKFIKIQISTTWRIAFFVIYAIAIAVYIILMCVLGIF